MERIAVWALFTVTMGIYLAMLLWSLPRVAEAAGGLTAFDLRPGGYSFEEAMTFLSALTAEGNAFYRGTQHLLDAAYPPLMSLTLFLAIAGLSAAIGHWRWVLAAVALPSALFDLAENVAVDRMLAAGAAGLTADLVETASFCTVLKSLSSAAGLTVFLASWSWWWLARLRRPPEVAGGS